GGEAEPDRVVSDREHDRNSRGCTLGRERWPWTSGSDDQCDAPADEVSRQFRQPLHLVVCEAIFGRDVLAFYVARLPQALAESSKRIEERVRRLAVKEPDYRHAA